MYSDPGGQDMSIIIDVPAMFHVGGLVHAHRQFDFQIHILAVLGHYHLVKLCRFGPVCGGVKNHLDRTTDSKREREKKRNKLLGLIHLDGQLEK